MLDEARYEEARDAALIDLKRHPELDHDEEIWVAFTERIVLGMGGESPVSRVVAEELTSRWQQHENFELYEDMMPVLDELRAAGLKIGLVSNSARDVHEFALHHALDDRCRPQLVPPRQVEAACVDLPRGARAPRCRSPTRP